MSALDPLLDIVELLRKGGLTIARATAKSANTAQLDGDTATVPVWPVTGDMANGQRVITLGWEGNLAAIGATPIPAIPTDPYQSGTSGDSSYWKWQNGLAVCTLTTTSYSQAINTAYGSLYQGVYNWAYPVAFVAKPAVTCSMFKYDTGASWGTVSAISTGQAELRGIDAFSRPGGAACQISAIAIGRWK